MIHANPKTRVEPGKENLIIYHLVNLVLLSHVSYNYGNSNHLQKDYWHKNLQCNLCHRIGHISKTVKHVGIKLLISL